jgi:hypothetical protein
VLEESETPESERIFSTKAFERHWFVLMAQEGTRLRGVSGKEWSYLDH